MGGEDLYIVGSNKFMCARMIVNCMPRTRTGCERRVPPYREKEARNVLFRKHLDKK